MPRSAGPNISPMSRSSRSQRTPCHIASSLAQAGREISMVARHANREGRTALTRSKLTHPRSSSRARLWRGRGHSASIRRPSRASRAISVPCTPAAIRSRWLSGVETSSAASRGLEQGIDRARGDFDRHAGDPHERARPRRRARIAGFSGEDPVGGAGALHLRILLAPAGGRSSQPRPHRRARGRHRQSLFHHGYGSRAASGRIVLRSRGEGDAGRRRLFGRPAGRTRRRRVSTSSAMPRRSHATSRSWTRPHSPLPARRACR